MARVPGVGSGASGHVVVVLVSSTCGEERPVDNLAAARDEAATSFLLLRLQVSWSTPPSALVHGTSGDIVVLVLLVFSTILDQVLAG